MAITIGGHAQGAGDAGADTLASAAFNAASTDPVAGSTMVVWITWNDGDASFVCTGVTDNASGNTYSAAGSAVTQDGYLVQAWTAKNVATTTGFVVTAAFTTGTTLRRLIAVEIKGADLTSPVGLYGGQGQSPGITTSNGTTTGALGTPAQDGHVILGAGFSTSWPDNFNVGTGYTEVERIEGNSYLVVEQLIQTTAAAAAGTFTQDTTATTIAVGISIKAAGGGTPLNLTPSGSEVSSESGAPSVGVGPGIIYKIRW